VIDAVLPCLNEAAALPWVLSRIPFGYRPIVVDNGSTDGSPGVAARLGATLVQASPPGFGAAAHAGLEAATADIVCFLDADGSLDPRQLPRVSDVVAAGRADLVLGRRRSTVRSRSSASTDLARRGGDRQRTRAVAQRRRREAGWPKRSDRLSDA
jgi:glycosyltransferase involved in cell wall biosynthesis